MVNFPRLYTTVWGSRTGAAFGSGQVVVPAALALGLLPGCGSGEDLGEGAPRPTEGAWVSPSVARGAAPGSLVGAGQTVAHVSELRDRELGPTGLDGGLTGEGSEQVSRLQRYIVRLSDPALACYAGTIAGLAATRMVRGVAGGGSNRTPHGTLDTTTAASSAYLGYLAAERERVLTELHAELGREPQLGAWFAYALNGFTLQLSASEAQRVAQQSGVKSVERSRLLGSATVTGPEWIEAHEVWNQRHRHRAGGQGEGIVFGLIDGGINHRHPSFAAVGEDGYAHENPLGPGVFLGECGTRPGLCNSKLIGAYAFLEAFGGVDSDLPEGAPLSQDSSGHGSHVAGIAVGNVLASVPLSGPQGVASGELWGPLSGVAPHANLISYKVCRNAGCGTADIVRAVEQAVVDGVDVLNVSIRSPSGDPWSQARGVAFLNARAAGILVHSAAGNSPGVGQVSRTGNAPWVTSVGWTTHPRLSGRKQLVLSGGSDPVPGPLVGLSLSDGYSGALAHAGDFDNGTARPRHCSAAFPPGTFDGQIVVCDRSSEVSEAVGCAAVMAGGAGGCVMAYQRVSAVPDLYASALPSIHIDEISGDALRAWLRTGHGHSATISAARPSFESLSTADVLSPRSSAGPFFELDLLAPSVVAPGVEILSAGAEVETQGRLVRAPVVGRFGFLSGSSMAAPHVAGAAVLLRQQHPDWTAAEIQSALMTTGETSVRRPNGTLATPLEQGAGRVRLGRAARAGLVLDESAARFTAANPAVGGEPSELNLPALVRNPCLIECGWERTFRATRSGQWKVRSDGDVPVFVSPDSFWLDKGESQSVTIQASVGDLPQAAFAFGALSLEPERAHQPPIRLPIAVRPASSSAPEVLHSTVDPQRSRKRQRVHLRIALRNPTLQAWPEVSLENRIPAGLELVESSLSHSITNGATVHAWSAQEGALGWVGALGGAEATLVLGEASSPRAYVSLAARGVAPVECEGADCDEGSTLVEGVEIGFGGETFTSVRMSANGTLELGDQSGVGSGFSPRELPDAESPNHLLAPFWADLVADGGHLYWATLAGEAGQEFEVFSWEEVRPFSRLLEPSHYSFQIWSERGTDNIWFVYGSLGALPSELFIGFQRERGELGVSRFFNGRGVAPESGQALKLGVLEGGRAEFEFDAEVRAPAGTSIVNRTRAQIGSRRVEAATRTLVDASSRRRSGGSSLDAEGGCRHPGTERTQRQRPNRRQRCRHSRQRSRRRNRQR